MKQSHYSSADYPVFPIRDDIPDVLFKAITPSVRCVLLGESTHGTHEFYKLRSAITKQLVSKHHFSAIFIEADWPKVYRLNQYVLGELIGTEESLDTLFADLNEYPLWMYRNEIIKELVLWLKRFNRTLRDNGHKSEMVNFFGIDMQSYDSLDALRAIYKEHHKSLPHSKAMVSLFNTSRFGRQQMKKAMELFESSKDKALAETTLDLVHNIEQNLMTLDSAITYFKTGNPWDLRDEHWLRTIEKYFQFNASKARKSKGRVVLWAHNSHIFDAAFTNYDHSNIGAMTRKRFGRDAVFSLGFDTFRGSVTATDEWGERAKCFQLNINVKESFGALLSQKAQKWKQNAFLMVLKNGMRKLNQSKAAVESKFRVSSADLARKHIIRDIGVCYGRTDPYGHCSNGDLTQLADALIFVNVSHALEPFQSDKHKQWDRAKETL